MSSTISPETDKNMSEVDKSTETTNTNDKSQENNSSKDISLFDINYKIKYVKCGKASIGTILLVLYRKINSFGNELKIQDNKYEIFNHMRNFYDNIDKLYRDALEISSAFSYTELIKVLFENKLDGGLWVPRELLNLYVPATGKYIDRCDSYELVNLLYGKIRMWSIVLKKYGCNRKFSADTTALGDLFESFAEKLPERKVRVGKVTVASKNDETDEIEENICDFEEYYEEFADMLFTNLRSIEIEKRSESKKPTLNNDRNNKNQRKNSNKGKNITSKK